MLTRDEAIERLNEAFVVLATTNIRELPTEVELGTADGMPRACVLNADHAASLPRSYLGDLIATLSSGWCCARGRRAAGSARLLL